MGITSIWDNTFYKNAKPLPRWCFEVNFGNLQNTDKKSKVQKTQLENTLNLAVQSVSIGRRETSIVKTYYAGIEANIPGRYMNTGELNIVFNEDNNLRITKMLEQIFEDSCCQDDYFAGKSYTPATAWHKNSKVIEVKVLKWDDSGVVETGKEVVCTYKFHGCILTSLNEEEFSYSNTDDVLQRTARFSYDYMTKE